MESIDNEVLDDVEKLSVDFIFELYRISANHIVEKIVKYLDAESLRNAEAVSKSWKKAIVSLNTGQLWKSLLNAKISRFPVWKLLHEVDSRNSFFGINKSINEVTKCSSTDDSLTSEQIYSKFEFVIKEMRKNWLNENGFTRETISLVSNLRGLTQIVAMNKYFAFYNHPEKTFHVWNRVSLTQVIVFQVSMDYPLMAPRKYYNFRVLDQTLIYPTSECRFVFVDLSNGMHTLQVPFDESGDFRYVSYLFTRKGFLSACVKTQNNDEDVASDIYLWKFKELNNIDWKSCQQLHFDDYRDKTIVFDHRFFMIRSYDEEILNIDIRETNSLEKRIELKESYWPRNSFCILHDGLIFHNHENSIKVLEVETGDVWIIWKNNCIDQQFFSLSLSPGSFHVCSLQDFGNSPSPSVESITLLNVVSWKLPEICNRKEKGLRNPYRCLKVWIPKFKVIYINEISISILRGSRVNTELKVDTLNFLPRCTSCKMVSSSLLECTSCRSVKYCSHMCQKMDWQLQHRKKCRKFSFYHDYLKNFIQDKTKEVDEKLNQED